MGEPQCGRNRSDGLPPYSVVGQGLPKTPSLVFHFKMPPREECGLTAMLEGKNRQRIIVHRGPSAWIVTCGKPLFPPPRELRTWRCNPPPGATNRLEGTLFLQAAGNSWRHALRQTCNHGKPDMSLCLPAQALLPSTKPLIVLGVSQTQTSSPPTAKADFTDKCFSSTQTNLLYLPSNFISKYLQWGQCYQDAAIATHLPPETHWWNSFPISWVVITCKYVRPRLKNPQLEFDSDPGSA